MHFSVIYDVEVAQHQSIVPFRPHRSDLWTLTEHNLYISRATEDDTTKQRKWVALLTRKQFEAWLERMPYYFTPDSIETCGSLGAPGLGMGLSPAISWSAPDLCYEFPNALYCEAYVTPIPDICNWPNDKRFDERNWQRIRHAILHYYG